MHTLFSMYEGIELTSLFFTPSCSNTKGSKINFAPFFVFRIAREGLERCDRMGAVAFRLVVHSLPLAVETMCFTRLRRGPKRSGVLEKPDPFHLAP